MIGSVLKSPFQPKAALLRVTSGVDVDRKIWLSGETITVGSSPECDLVLTSPQINPKHVSFTVKTFKDANWLSRLLTLFGFGDRIRNNAALRRTLGLEYKPSARPWYFNLSDHPANLFNGQPAPRSGLIEPGHTLRLGPHVTLECVKAPLADDAPAELSGSSTAVPIPSSAIWVSNLAIVTILVMLGWYVYQNVGANNTLTPRAPSQAAKSLEVENLFCGLASPTHKDDASNFLQESIASCLKYGDQSELPTAVYQSVEDMVIKVYLDLRATDTGAAIGTLRRMESFLGAGTCDMSRAIAKDIQSLQSGASVSPCSSSAQGSPR